MGLSFDWQNSCRDLKSRGRYILKNELWSDCRFLVGTAPNQQVFSGHKLVLSMSSPVLEKMFYGNLPDKTDPILIPDAKPDAFRAMLQYIYTDEISISSFDEACNLYYVAKKYLMSHLVQHCVQYLLDNLSPKNVCKAYEFAKFMEESEIVQRCFEIIKTKTKDVLMDPSFGDVELTTLLVIFDQDELNIDSELMLFNALSKYAADRGFCGYQCKSREQSHVPEEPCNQPEDMEDLPEAIEAENELVQEPQLIVNNDAGGGTSEQSNRNSHQETAKNTEIKLWEEMLIKEAVKKVRFLTLTPKQFAQGPAQSSLLTKVEALAIFIIISSSSTDYPIPEGFCASRQKRNRNFLVHQPNEVITCSHPHLHIPPAPARTNFNSSFPSFGAKSQYCKYCGR